MQILEQKTSERQVVYNDGIDFVFGALSVLLHKHFYRFVQQVRGVTLIGAHSCCL